VSPCFRIDRDFDMEFDHSAQDTVRVLALLLQSQRSETLNAETLPIGMACHRSNGCSV
jgi:hypothetical protein